MKSIKTDMFDSKIKCFFPDPDTREMLCDLLSALLAMAPEPASAQVTPAALSSGIRGQTSLDVMEWIAVQDIQDHTGMDVGMLNFLINEARNLNVPAEQVVRLCRERFSEPFRR